MRTSGATRRAGPAGTVPDSRHHDQSGHGGPAPPEKARTPGRPCGHAARNRKHRRHGHDADEHEPGARFRSCVPPLPGSQPRCENKDGPTRDKRAQHHGRVPIVTPADARHHAKTPAAFARRRASPRTPLTSDIPVIVVTGVEGCLLRPHLSSMAEPKDHIASNVVCPRCRCSGHVHVSPLIMTAERHLHYHCTCCRHVWVVRDRRSKERHSEHQPPYQPPMSKWLGTVRGILSWISIRRIRPRPRWTCR